jgi:flagellar basal body-associated protein FliL
MSKKRHAPQSKSSSRKQKRQQGSPTSLIIPIIVGLVVVAVIVGVIVSAEDRQLATNSTSPSVNTAQALNTEAIPFPDIPRITLADTQNELAKGQAVLIDVRIKSSYDSAHAVGAISIPEEEIDAHLNELVHNKDLILYCT